MTPRKRKAAPEKADLPAKRAPRGRAVKKQDDPVWATQNPNSHLVDQDLHAKYCDPLTYENWTKEDWEEIRDCLPENAPFNDDGYSVPMHFFKYDQDWRRLVREFQEDLGAGRYEPQWLKQAALAMEERAAGKFDEFKEDRFEAFWGQKQKSHHDERAGESAKIKLSQLVEAGLIKLGDDLSYRRTFRSKAGVLLMIEKDLRVVAITGTTLTVAIPPGQFRYPRFLNPAEASIVAHPNNSMVEKEESQRDQTTEKVEGDVSATDSTSTSRGLATGTEISNGSTKAPGDASELQTSVDSSQASKVPTPDISSSNGRFAASQVNAKPDDAQKIAESNAVAMSMSDESNNEGNKSVLGASEVNSNSESRIQNEFVNKHKPSSAADEPREVDAIANTAIEHDSALVFQEHESHIDPETGCFLYDVWKPKGLESRIITIDGRMDPKDIPIASCWKYIRVQRNNQDLGSLFDIREELYVWESSTIVKMPKKGRGKDPRRLNGEVSKNHTETPRKGAKLSHEDPVSPGTPLTNRKVGRSRTAKTRGTEASDDNEVTEESEDDESAAERESDGEFTMNTSSNKRAKQRTKPPGRPTRSAGQSTKTTMTTDSLADDSYPADTHNEDYEETKESGKKGRIAPKHRAEHIVWCPHCGTGFTQETNMKMHIRRKRCKKLPAE